MSMDLESDDFAPESATGSPRAGAVTVGAVTVGAVLAAATPLHWDEGVAIFQELVDVLTSTNRDDIPGFEDVLIDADGKLTIRGTTRRLERGPIAAGRALHTLLATADVPVALRLFVTQANAPETHRSLAAFGKGLAYFGKSDRAELIRAVYARYKPAAAAASVPPNGPPSPPPARTPPPSRPAERLKSRATFRHGLVAAAVIGLLASGGAIGWILFTRAPRPASEATPQAKSAPPASTARPAKHAADSSSSRASKTQAIPQASASPPRTVEPSVPLRAQGALSRSGSIVVAERREGIRANADPTLVLPRAESARTSSPVQGLAPDTVSAPATVAAREAGPRASAAIYSGEDRDVQPPLMLSPQLPPPLMIGGPADSRVNRMELVVATDGTVERVRLIGAPSRMADMMLLSGAKLWKFAPAIKDGVPVRYRTMVSWMVFP